MDAKYVVIDTPEGGLAAFIFPPFIKHSDFVMYWCPYKNPIATVMSGGFVALTPEGPVAYGEATSLRLKSDPERDTKLLRRLLSDL